MESGTASRRAIDASTLVEAFHITASQRPDQVAVRTIDDDISWTWSELRERVDALAGGLAKLGVQRGDTVALMLSNRPEFHLCDLAVATVGGTAFSIYQTYTPEQIEYVVADAASRVIITEQTYLPNVLQARRNLPGLEHLVVVDGEAPERSIRLDAVEGSNPTFDAEAAAAAVQPDDILTLIYTSGTTGPPKGVQLSNRNLAFLLPNIDRLLKVPESGRVISWLPSAHIAERAAHHYLPVILGLTITTCPNARDVVGYLPQVRPNFFFAVPRIWEKLKSGLEAAVGGMPDEQREAARSGLEAAVEKVRREQRGEPVPDDVVAKAAEADEQLFSKWRAMLGLDEAVAIHVGAAPTPVEVLEFFHAIGLPLAELWGMSETCGVATMNPPEKIRIGTVGPPMPGVEIKLADDGEILVRSGGNMVGYRNQPEKTAETFTEDGWLLTGDIGAFDDHGYLKIVDRKKEIIINAAGKNMSPANIEAELRSSSPIIGQACAIGDGRPYNTALIVLDSDFAPAWAAQQGIEDTALATLARDERVRAAVQEAVDAANTKLARVEQIKKFHIVEGDWLPGGDELTPTMKLKRKPIDAKYAREIEALYAS
jgi:long-subunit acyl-CoA synthetase (AMP-forming)